MTKCRPKFLKIIICQKSSKLPTSVTKLCQNAPFFNSKTRAPQQSGRELKQHARARSPNTGRRSAGCAAPASRPAGSPPSIYRRGPAMHVSLRRRIFFAAQNSEEYGVSFTGRRDLCWCIPVSEIRSLFARKKKRSLFPFFGSAHATTLLPSFRRGTLFFFFSSFPSSCLLFARNRLKEGRKSRVEAKP